MAIAGWAFVATVLVEPIFLRFLVRRRILAVPNERTSHDQVTPRGGGFVVVAAFVVVVGVLSKPTPGLWTTLLSVSLFGLLGGLDDVFVLTAKFRLVGQIVLAGLTAVLLASELLETAWSSIGFVVFGVLWIIFFVNAFNFMDGINGISIAQTAGFSISLLLLQRMRGISVGAFGAGLFGAVLGFAPFNFRNRGRALVFLGDSGSYGLGAALSVIPLIVLAQVGPIGLIAFAPLALYGADVLWTLLSRFRRGERLMEAHRSHLYQRLTAPPKDLSHVTVSLLLLVGSTFLGLVPLMFL
jgi:UDP-GlcNAc:undecaprenyl-phosphate/decaprenyl-phosphate GlcNAc-1-phosphate transferase